MNSGLSPVSLIYLHFDVLSQVERKESEWELASWELFLPQAEGATQILECVLYHMYLLIKK